MTIDARLQRGPGARGYREVDHHGQAPQHVPKWARHKDRDEPESGSWPSSRGCICQSAFGPLRQRGGARGYTGQSAASEGPHIRPRTPPFRPGHSSPGGGSPRSRLSRAWRPTSPAGRSGHRCRTGWRRGCREPTPRRPRRTGPRSARTRQPTARAPAARRAGPLPRRTRDRRTARTMSRAAARLGRRSCAAGAARTETSRRRRDTGRRGQQPPRRPSDRRQAGAASRSGRL